MRKIEFLLLMLLVFVVSCKSYSYETPSSKEIKEFSVIISNYNYNPSSIVVDYGDKVIVNIKNNDAVTHGISLQEFGVREFVKPGETKTIQFIASQRGQPATFCSTDHGEKLSIKVI